MSLLNPPPYAPLFINSFSFRWSGIQSTVTFGGLTSSFASAAWPSANLAIYVPISIRYAYQVNRVFWYNGGTASGNVDLAIYNDSLSRLWSVAVDTNSGSAVAQSG